MELELLIEVLEHSIKKNGDKPVTLSHLLAILKMVDRKMEQSDRLDLIGMGNDD